MPRRHTLAARHRHDQQAAHEKDHRDRHRRAIPGPVLDKEPAEDRKAQDLGRSAGAAAGQQIDLVEHLERDHQAERQLHRQRRPHQRQRHIAQLLAERGAVDPRGLVDVLRQAFEPGEAQEETERRPVPDIDDDHRQQRRRRRPKPILRRHPGEPDDLVDEPEIVIVHQLPDRPDDDARDEDRQDEHRAIRDPPAPDPPAQDGEEEPEHHLGAHRGDGEDNCVDEPCAEQRVLRQRGVIGEPHRRPHGLSLRPGHMQKARREQVGERQDTQRQHREERRRQGCPAPQSVVAEPARHLTSAAAGFRSCSRTSPSRRGSARPCR